MDRRNFLWILGAAFYAGPAFAQGAAPAADTTDPNSPVAHADRFWTALSARKRTLDAAFIEKWFSKAATGRLLEQLRVNKPEYTNRLVWALSQSLFDETLDSALRARLIRAEAGRAEAVLEAPEATPSTFRLWLTQEAGGWRVDELGLEYGSSLRELLEAGKAPAGADARPQEAATAYVEKTIKAAQAAHRKDRSLLSEPSQIRLLCEAALAKALLKEAANTDDSETRLDFDPILGGQDSAGVADLTTRVTGSREGRTLVEARWKDGKTPMRALFDLTPGASGWLIADITQYSIDRLDTLFRNELK